MVFAVGYSGPGQLSVVTSTPVPYSYNNSSNGGGGNNQSALAMFSAAVRDLPIDMVQNAIAQAAPPSRGLTSSNNNTNSQGHSTRSLTAATTFPLNPATANFRGGTPFDNNFNSEVGRPDNSWGPPAAAGYRPPNKHFDEAKQSQPPMIHGISRNIHPISIPPPYGQQPDLYITRNSGLYARYDPRTNAEGRQIEGASPEYGQLSSSPSSNSINYPISSTHSNTNMQQYQLHRSKNNPKGISQQLPPQQYQHHSEYSADIFPFPNYPSQSQSDQTTLPSRRTYYS